MFAAWCWVRAAGWTAAKVPLGDEDTQGSEAWKWDNALQAGDALYL